MTEYSFLNCIRYRNAKTGQSICSNQQVVCKDANCVANAETKYIYLELPMQKQKHNQNLSVECFIFRMRFNKISLFIMVLKRLKLHQFLMVRHELYPTHKHGCRKGGRNLKCSGTWLFSEFRVVKNTFHHFSTPYQKNVWKNPLVPPPSRKTSFRRPCVAKLHHFWKKVCCISPSDNTFSKPSDNTFSNTNAVSKP